MSLYIYYRAAALRSEVEVVCLRDRHREGERSVSHSIVLSLNVQPLSVDSGMGLLIGYCLIIIGEEHFIKILEGSIKIQKKVIECKQHFQKSLILESRTHIE